LDPEILNQMKKEIHDLFDMFDENKDGKVDA